MFLGGGLGAVARYALAVALPREAVSTGTFPWATLLANFLACLLLGIGIVVTTRGYLPRGGQLLLLTGFCGGFSTFSTFAAELLQMGQSGQLFTAVTYLAVSLLSGIAALLGVLYFFPAEISG